VKKNGLIKLLVVAFSITSLGSLYPSLANAGIIIENFDGPALNKQLWNPYNYDQHQRSIQQDGVLKIQIDGASTGDEWFGAGINGMFGLKGNFEIVADYNLTNWPTSNGVRANIMFSEIYNPNGKSGHVDRCSFGADEPPNPKESYVTAFNDDLFLDVVIKSTTDISGKLKLTRVGKIITGYFWQNNAWQTIGSHDYSATGLGDWLRIGLNAHSTTVSRLPDGQLVHPFAGKDVEMVFDNLQITYDQIQYAPRGPAPGSLLLLLSD
jgi:hypothetical protein